MALQSVLAYRNTADLLPLTTDAPTTIQSLSNLQTRGLANQCILQTDPSGPFVSIYVDLNTWPSGISKQVFAMMGEDMFGFQLYTNASASLSGATDLGSVSSANQFATPSLPSVALADISGYTLQRYLIVFASWIPDDGIFKFGRLWLGDSIPLPDGADGTWSISGNDSGILTPSRGQQIYEDEGVKTRVLTMSMTNMSHEAAYGLKTSDETDNGYGSNMLEMMMSQGITGEILACANLRTSALINRTAVYGHLAVMPTITRESGTLHSSSVTIVEER